MKANIWTQQMAQKELLTNNLKEFFEPHQFMTRCENLEDGTRLLTSMYKGNDIFQVKQIGEVLVSKWFFRLEEIK